MSINKSLLTCCICAVFIIAACRKTDNPEISRRNIQTAVEYTNEIYLWNDQLKQKADMRASRFSNLEEMMDYIQGFSFETSANRNVDEWSFAIKKSEWDDISQGIAGDFGLGVFFMSDKDLRVKSVERLSPAGKAGITRGWQITKINDITDINSSDATIKKIVAAIFSSKSAKITFKKPDGSSQEYTLNAATYNEQPMQLDTVYNTNVGKVGYMVYNSFLGDSADVVNNYKRVFSKFSTAGISNLIVDLRYNGGGYVWMQELLTNYLVNNSAAGTGKIMYSENFNRDYSDWDTTIYFNKQGPLNLSTLYIITSGGTASASELLINSLKPYMTVKTVGSNTEGKAVGFFPIEIKGSGWYIFPVSFRSLNSNKEGNYFDGIKPTKTAADGLDRNWGDRNETSLAAALADMGAGTMARMAITAEAPVTPVANNKFLVKPGAVRGAIENRRRGLR